MKFSKETNKAHRISWFVYAGFGADKVKIPHTAMMAGQWGYDVVCSCGEFETKVGGGTKGHLLDLVWHHKFSEGTFEDEEV